MNYYVNCCDFFEVAPHERLDKDGFEVAIQQDSYIAFPANDTAWVAFFRPNQSINKNIWTKTQKKVKKLRFVVQDDASNAFFDNKSKFDNITIIKMKHFALPVNSEVNEGFQVTILEREEFINLERYGINDDTLALPTIPFDDQLITLHNARVVLGAKGATEPIIVGSVLLLEHRALDLVFNYKVV